jgi:hypothetical protein
MNNFILSISQRYGSADPDPQQNVTDLQHWLTGQLFSQCEVKKRYQDLVYQAVLLIQIQSVRFLIRIQALDNSGSGSSQS